MRARGTRWRRLGTARKGAAPWGQYANVTKGYGVRYGEIGNEQYGDGIYGAN